MSASLVNMTHFPKQNYNALVEYIYDGEYASAYDVALEGTLSSGDDRRRKSTPGL